MTLLVPAAALADLERDRWAQSQHDYAKEFERRVLKHLDPRLELRFVHPSAPREYDVIPGRWHVVLRNEQGPDTWKPITGPNGEYIEPHGGLVEQLQSMDLTKVNVKDYLYERRQKEARRRAKAMEADRQERVEEITDRFKAFTPGVSLTSLSNGWKYRAGARRG